MGNRAVITTEAKDLGVYLHWNGGRDSVEGFLTYCKIKGYRTPESNCYGWAYLCTTIGNFLGDISLGIDKYKNLDTRNGDNGVYIIKDWEIIGREYMDGAEQHEYDLWDMVQSVNETQGSNIKLSDDELKQKFDELNAPLF